LTKKELYRGSKKPIGLWTATSIGIGGMIGAGIFSILGIAASVSGNAMHLSFIIAGLVALLSTYSYAKLGVRYPSAGGPVEFLVKGFGDGIISGGLNIVLWIGYIFVLALYAKAFGGYAKTFMPTNVSGSWENIFATAIVLIFAAVNFIGAKAVGKSEFLIVAVKVVILLMFVSVGFFFMKPDLLSFSHWPHVSNIFYGAGIVFVAYEGFGLVTNAAEDMENPEKTLPRALYLSVIIVIVVYASISLTVLGNLPIAEIINAEEYALAAAAKPFLGLIGFKIVAIAALFSTSSAINATLYGGTNVSYAIAKKGELPKVFERKLWGRDSEGLFITAGLVILFVNLFRLEGVALLGSASFLLIYAAVNLAHLRLARETGAKPILIWLSIGGCFASLGILVLFIIKNSALTLVVLASLFFLAFAVEWGYRMYSQRLLKCRS
jgi:amino acid transporter